jgi:hypothetical protein
MNTLDRGNAAEAAVLHRLIAAGIPVLVPFGGGLSFDLGAVVPPDGEILRIQVKSGRVRNGCVAFNTWGTDHGKGRLSYQGRADILAVHAPELSDILMVPVEDCIPFRGRFRIDPTRNNQRSGVRFAADYLLEKWIARLEPWSVVDADRDHLGYPLAERPPPPPRRLRRAAGGG